MLDYKKIKSDFNLSFDKILKENYHFKILLYEIFVYGSAYLIGGFLRDLIDNKKSRDIDIIVDLKHEKLLEVIMNSNINYKINRHNGIKLILENIEVDIWSINNNWAFKNNLVKLDENDKLNSIAKGCFYNYDSLVINLHKNTLNLKHYDKFLRNSQLDILEKSPLYKILNPTIEANILRAFYLKKIMNISFSLNTYNYLLREIDELKSNLIDPFSALTSKKKEYPKYEIALTNDDIYLFLKDLESQENLGGQLYFKF